MRISFGLAIFDSNKWNKLLSKAGRTRWPNKAWEIEVHYLGWGRLIEFDFSWTRKTDHAGVCLQLGLLGYSIEAQIYDSRHWDDERDDYVVYDET